MNERLPSPTLSSSHGALSARLSESPAATLRRLGPAIAGYGLPFVLILYLALRNGGYDSIVRSEVGIAVWWLVLLGAAVGALPVARISRGGWIALALLGGFALWTGLGIGWSESSERSVAELARVATYLGVFALALSAQGRERSAPRRLLRRRRDRRSSGSSPCSRACIRRGFPTNEAADVLADARSRLNYPLNYWNGLAALIAIGVPLLLVIATNARARSYPRARRRRRAGALRWPPIYTLSRGGAVELAAGAGRALGAPSAPLAAAREPLAIAGLGATLAIAAASQRDALADGLNGQLARSQGDEMLAMVLVVCAGVGLLQAALSLAARTSSARGSRSPAARHGRRGGARRSSPLLIALAVGLPGELSGSWEEFKDPTAGRPDIDRSSASRAPAATAATSTGRRRSTRTQAEPLTGIGPGTFEFWWAREGTIPGLRPRRPLAVLRDAGRARDRRLCSDRRARADGARRLASGGRSTPSTGAPRPGRRSDRRLPCVRGRRGRRLGLGARRAAGGVLAPGRRPRSWRRGSTGDAERRWRSPRARSAALSAAALVAIAIPLAGAASIRDSQRARVRDALDHALDARTARRDPAVRGDAELQEALVLELQATSAPPPRPPARRPRRSRRTGAPGSCSRASRPARGDADSRDRSLPRGARASTRDPRCSQR